MKQNIAEKLYEKYPKILGSVSLSCGEGWYHIIDSLCSRIQDYIDWNNKDEKKIPQVEALQIKEKFGGLRFYYVGGDDYISGLVDFAEDCSYFTCDCCGNLGENRTDLSWCLTLCDKHYEERKEEIKNRGY